MTFLSIYTPTHGRPTLLVRCKESVDAQTTSVDHVIVHDAVGLGVAGMFADIPNHAHKPHGEYVMVLSDDNVLADQDFAAELEACAAAYDDPDVIVFKGVIGSTVQPAAWNCEPEVTKIDLSCFAVKRDLWVKHAADWGHRYEGDFDFVHTLWDAGYRFHWWDRLAFQALQIGQGRPE